MAFPQSMIMYCKRIDIFEKRNTSQEIRIIKEFHFQTKSKYTELQFILKIFKSNLNIKHFEF